MTPIFDETLEPPTIAANGRLGSLTAPSYGSTIWGGGWVVISKLE